MAYTAETLASLSDIDLDSVVEEMVIGIRPEPGLLQRIKRRAVRRLSRNGSDGEFPAYSNSHAGMALVMEGMLARGFTVAVAPGGVVWVAGNGKELKYVGGVAMLGNNIDLSSISGANNDPNFGIRLVSIYDPNGAADGLTMHVMYDGVETPYRAGDAAHNHPE